MGGFLTFFNRICWFCLLSNYRTHRSLHIFQNLSLGETGIALMHVFRVFDAFEISLTPFSQHICVTFKQKCPFKNEFKYQYWIESDIQCVTMVSKHTGHHQIWIHFPKQNINTRKRNEQIFHRSISCFRSFSFLSPTIHALYNGVTGMLRLFCLG